MDQADRSWGASAKMPPLPFRLDAGWFEVRDDSGRYLGLLVHALELCGWIQRQRPGACYRVSHRSAGWPGREATIIDRWLATPRPEGWMPKLEPVARFGPDPGRDG